MKNVQKVERMFETADIDLAATLCALGAALVKIDRRNTTRCVFVFEGGQEIDRVVRAYWRHEITIEPQSVLYSLKALKTRLYSEV